jgi:hypothetical protein
MIGLGMATAILVDALVVRLVLVHAIARRSGVLRQQRRRTDPQELLGKL